LAGPVALALVRGGVEGSDAYAESPRIAADLVQRDQPVVDIEARVFHCLRHDRPGELLQTAREALDLVTQRSRRRRDLTGQHPPEEVERGPIGRRTPLARDAYRPVDVAQIGGAWSAIVDVRTVDRQ